MSQIIKNGGGGGGPTVPTQFTEDSGVAVPAANNLNVFGGSGITTSGAGSTVTISIKNSTTDTGQTVNAQTINLSTINCSVIGTYFIETRLAAWSIAGVNGAGGSLYTTVISDGVTVTVIDDTDSIAHVSVPIAAIDYNVVGSGTNAILQVTGAAGFTINWGAFSVYVFRGA